MGALIKKVKNRKVNSMLFKNACMCVNIKMKAKMSESGCFWAGEDGMEEGRPGASEGPEMS